MTSKEDNKLAKWQLTQKQSVHLPGKLVMTIGRIKAFHRVTGGKMYVAFSGGRDSTVLLDIVRRLYPDTVAVFNDTGLEYPEVLEFIKTIENVHVLKPKKSFLDVITEHGYPVISKDNAQKIDEIRNTGSEKLRNIRLFGGRNGNGKLPEKWKYMIDAPFKISDRCCHILKKNPAKAYEKTSGNSAIIGTMACDSRNRESAYLKNGCMNLGSGRNTLAPLSFWTHQDIKDYVEKYSLPVSKIYSMGYEHTGCVFCAFGCHLETRGEGKFYHMQKTHPQMFKYCMENLGLREKLKFMGIEIPVNKEKI